ncbi:MAG TPA: hypothetical protein PK005_05200 [Bacteroidales bacterium]|jgi:hypothetical protein|nr:hypothetical protein [Bacteroidales bacterium]MDI9532606.1 hypothetical protein [Bacteroidota bacterium]MBK7732858.1 hypothetical protein [Bacteroidales bacterium]MBP8708987.1 hypothetical protein [Bacteroidales bacterium]MZQ79730.1 hypothetical protein [Bacteroidales bacterium]
MNPDIIKSLDLMGKGMTAIFVVIIVIYLSVNLMLRLTESKKKETKE